MHLNQIEIYEEAFNKLYQILGVKDVSQIIVKFKANEEEIHRSVEYINANNADRSQLKEEIDNLKNQKLHTLTNRKANDDKFRQQILELDVCLILPYTNCISVQLIFDVSILGGVFLRKFRKIGSFKICALNKKNC